MFFLLLFFFYFEQTTAESKCYSYITLFLLCSWVYVYVRTIAIKTKLKTRMEKYFREFEAFDETEKLDISQNTFLRVSAFQMIYS